MDVVFVHGALVRDGAWWWGRTADLLRERTGVSSRVVALPSCGETVRDGAVGGLDADAAALRQELDRGGAAMVVGHSYGGTVIAEAGHHPAVSNLLYISSYLPSIGETQSSIMSGEVDPVTVGDAGEGWIGLTGYDAHSFGVRFLQDVDRDTRREGWDRVSPQAANAFTTPTSRAGWKGIDSTYLVCTKDRSTSIDLQRSHAARATRYAEVATGHHPFISRPDLVVSQIEAILGRSPRVP